MFIHSAVIIPSKILRMKSIITKEYEMHTGKIRMKPRITVAIAVTYVPLIILKEKIIIKIKFRRLS